MAPDCEEDLDIPLNESPVLVGGVESQISLKSLYRNRGESQCKVVSRVGFIFYRCFTCGLDPSSANMSSGVVSISAIMRGTILGGPLVEMVGSALWGSDFMERIRFCASNPRHPRLCSLTHEIEEEHLGSTLDGVLNLVLLHQSQIFLHQLLITTLLTQSMIENRRKFTSDVEFEIEYSKVHWSEVDSTPTMENFGELNRTYFFGPQAKV